MKNRKNVAVILAAGSGTRAAMPIPKQFMKLSGKTVLEHTLDVFENHKKIDEIAIVTKPEYFDRIEEMIIKNNYLKCKKILNGGAERYHSSLSAINAYQSEDNINLLIHDGVRPLLSDRIIRECVDALQTYSSVDVAIPSDDTIIEVDGEYLKNIPPRITMWRGQTPQCFHAEVLKKAYDAALKDPNFQTTDDCKIVNYYLPDTKTYIVMGDRSNIKFTYIEDLYAIENHIQLKNIEVDTNISLEELKDKTIVVFGGTGGIGLSVCELATKHGANAVAFGRRNGVDIANPDSVREALKSVGKPIDAVIVTAALLKKEPLHSMSYDDIIEMSNVNYLGSIICAKEAYPYLKETKGTLLLFSSSSYNKGRSFYSPYSSSKSAIVNITQALADEWKQSNIKVNCITPERTKTEMRTKTFGYEAEETLLSPNVVAEDTLKAIFSESTGQVINIKKKIN